MRKVSLALAVTLLVVVSLGAQTVPRMTVFPQIAVGGDWTSDFFVTNQGFTTVQGIDLSLFNDDGSHKVVDTPDLGSTWTFGFNLAPGETKVIRATAVNATAPQGFAELYAPPLSSLRATMVVRWAPGGQIATQLGIPEQFPFSMFSVAGEVNALGNTALAIAIPTFGYTDVRNQQVLVSVMNQSGTIVGTQSVPVLVGQHTAFFLRDLFANLNLTDFRGRVIVNGSDWLGVAALRQEGPSLGTVAVDDGAALSPFFLSQATTPEVEPNNSVAGAQALTLPTVISGVISSSSDVDYYSFTGNQGDIVSAMTDTTSSGVVSDLDSQISLLNSQGNEIAYNDQNGTRGANENDSLIRMVLPYTGTYTLVVSDYWGDGGATFGYRLHVKIQTP
jgi:hypothetical protein